MLERNGWIQASVGKDRRAREFTLTTIGRRRLAAAKPEWKTAQDELRSAMTSEHWEAMFLMFPKITGTAQTCARRAAHRGKL